MAPAGLGKDPFGKAAAERRSQAELQIEDVGGRMKNGKESKHYRRLISQTAKHLYQLAACLATAHHVL